MRRHGLRDRIRRQRRLTRRLASRHILIRRPNSVARILEALGAWTVEPPAAPSRFVPALIERDTEPVAAASDYLATPLASDEPRAPNERREDTLTPGATIQAEVGEPNAIPRSGRAPETPHRLARAAAVPPVAETEQRRAVSKADLPRAVAPTPSPRPPAEAARARVDAPRSDWRIARPAVIPPAATAETSAPARQGLTDVVQRPSDAGRPLPPQRAEPALADSATAVPTVSSSAPMVDSATPSGADRLDAPNAVDPEAKGEPVARAHVDTIPAADDKPTMPAEKTPHAEILERALKALRASGEVRPTASTPERTPAASGPTSVTRSPQTPSSRTVERSPGSSGSSGSSGSLVKAPPADAEVPPTAARVAPSAPAPTSAPPVTSASPTASAVSPVVSQQSETPMPVEPPVHVRSFGSLDTTIDDTNPARIDELPAKAPSAEAQSSPAAPDDDRVDAPPETSKVDERRQARRPAHLDRPRPASASSSPGPAGDAAMQPPPSAGRAAPNQGQFRFTEVERTIQDWQRLLFEATSPPRAAFRHGSAPRQTRAPSAAISPKRRGADAVDGGSRTTPNVAGPPADSSPAAGAVPPNAADPAAPFRDAERGTAAAAADQATTPHAGDDSPRAEAAQSAHVADAMRSIPAQPISPSTRRFLRPLVGIDPDSVRVHRGERAGRLTDQLRADAIAVGDDIAIGPGHDDRDPDTIALMAHELTHAARARDRRFVPPIARAVQRVDVGTADATSLRRPGAGGVNADATPPDDEEALARVVETRVRAAAARVRERVVEPNVALEPGSDDDFAELPGPDEPARTDAPAGRGEPARWEPTTGAVPRASASPWGALPAPWEPLPAGLARNHPAHAPAAVSMSPVAAPSPSPASISTAPAPTVHLAEHGRGAAGEEPAHADAPGHGAAEPDIDALARQVYSVLKRRLAAERRRDA